MVTLPPPVVANVPGVAVFAASDQSFVRMLPVAPTNGVAGLVVEPPVPLVAVAAEVPLPVVAVVPPLAVVALVVLSSPPQAASNPAITGAQYL